MGILRLVFFFFSVIPACVPELTEIVTLCTRHIHTCFHKFAQTRCKMRHDSLMTCWGLCLKMQHEQTCFYSYHGVPTSIRYKLWLNWCDFVPYCHLVSIIHFPVKAGSLKKVTFWLMRGHFFWILMCICLKMKSINMKVLTGCLTKLLSMFP